MKKQKGAASEFPLVMLPMCQGEIFGCIIMKKWGNVGKIANALKFPTIMIPMCQGKSLVVPPCKRENLWLFCQCAL